MKIKYIFEPKDFKGMGQILVRNYDFKGDYSLMASVAYKIGYKNNKGDYPRDIVKFSLTDGMSLTYDSLEKLCYKLNNDEVGYRPITLDELGRIIPHIFREI